MNEINNKEGLIIQEKLWKIASGLNCPIIYSDLRQLGLGGSFMRKMPWDKHGVFIQINRPFCAKKNSRWPNQLPLIANDQGHKIDQVDFIGEAVVLAHEVGHLISWFTEYDTARYVDYHFGYERLMTDKFGKFTLADGEAVLKEEEIAWEIGKSILQSFKVRNEVIQYLDICAKYSLNCYRSTIKEKHEREGREQAERLAPG